MKTRDERWLAKVEKTPTCWNWRGSVTGAGYGQFWNGERNIPAHYFWLETEKLEQLKDPSMEACHKCDNKLCVNPDHIFIGTRSDNERDKVSKGRHNTAPGCYAMLAKRDYRGSRNPQSKLTDEQVAEIRSTPRTRGEWSPLGCPIWRNRGVY